MPGREPRRRNRYYSPKVTWLLVILVGIAIIVVGLTMLSEDRYISQQNPSASDSLPTAAESPGASRQKEAVPKLSEKEDLTEWHQFDPAITEVNGTDRFVMLFFRSPDCPPCDSMQYLVFDQPEIQDEFKFKFLPVLISSASNQVISYQGRQIAESGLADLFNIPGYPSLLFYDGGSEKFVLTYPGYSDPMRLTRIFEYLKRRMFENSSMSLQQYLSEAE